MSPVDYTVLRRNLAIILILTTVLHLIPPKSTIRDSRQQNSDTSGLLRHRHLKQASAEECENWSNDWTDDYYNSCKVNPVRIVKKKDEEDRCADWEEDWTDDYYSSCWTISSPTPSSSLENRMCDDENIISTLGTRIGDGTTTTTGFMFDIEAISNNKLIFNSFDINTREKYELKMQVFTKAGTWERFSKDKSAWTELGTYKVRGQGKDKSTSLNMDEAIEIPSGSIQSFYIVEVDGYRLRYIELDNAIDVGTEITSDDNIVINAGKEIDDDPFSGVGGEMGGFSGTIHYTLCQSDEPTQPQTDSPTQKPTIPPTVGPTILPTQGSTSNPTQKPTNNPTQDPTNNPTQDPTMNPTQDPTINPTQDPTMNPTQKPTNNPTQYHSMNPTQYHSMNPTQYHSMNPTQDPTLNPTQDPTINPTQKPTMNPTQKPTNNPTQGHSMNPTQDPTNNPSQMPTNNPTQSPTINATQGPTPQPTSESTVVSTVFSSSEDPTPEPTIVSTIFPSSEDPTPGPTLGPTLVPTLVPTISSSNPPSVDTTAPLTSHPSPLPSPTKAPTITTTKVVKLSPFVLSFELGIPDEANTNNLELIKEDEDLLTKYTESFLANSYRTSITDQSAIEQVIVDLKMTTSSARRKLLQQDTGSSILLPYEQHQRHDSERMNIQLATAERTFSGQVIFKVSDEITLPDASALDKLTQSAFDETSSFKYVNGLLEQHGQNGGGPFSYVTAVRAHVKGGGDTTDGNMGSMSIEPIDTGLLAGSIVGVVVGVAAVGIFAFFVIRRRKRKRYSAREDAHQNYEKKGISDKLYPDLRTETSPGGKSARSNAAFYAQNKKGKRTVTEEDINAAKRGITSESVDGFSSYASSLRGPGDGYESSIAPPSYIADEDHSTIAGNYSYYGNSEIDESDGSYDDNENSLADMSTLGEERFNSVLQFDHMAEENVISPMSMENMLAGSASQTAQMFDRSDLNFARASAVTIITGMSNVRMPTPESQPGGSPPRAPLPVDFEPDELEPDEQDASIATFTQQNDYLDIQQNLDNFSIVSYHSSPDTKQEATENVEEQNTISSQSKAHPKEEMRSKVWRKYGSDVSRVSSIHTDKTTNVEKSTPISSSKSSMQSNERIEGCVGGNSNQPTSDEHNTISDSTPRPELIVRGYI